MTGTPAAEPPKPGEPSKAEQLLNDYTPVPEPTFMELQNMLFGREAEIFPVVITEKYRDDDDINQPVKFKETAAPGYYVRTMEIDEHANVKRMLEMGDKDIVKKVVKMTLVDKNKKQLIDPKAELSGPMTALILGAYDCAMIANRFFLKRWNPPATIAKNS